MSTFFNDTMQGLLEAIAIENGDIPMEEVSGMPATTYRARNIQVNTGNNQSQEQENQETLVATG